ncbi:MAG: hypothetical protein ACO3NW_09480 [Kiritimatiellia bacterium]
MSGSAKARTIYLVHHHLRRGGVSRVILHTAEILRDAGEQVCIVSGEESPIPLPEGLSFRVIPALGYAESAPDSGDLQDCLSEMYHEGDIWHVHNHSLGKNPAVTDVFLRLAEEGHLLILQPHDFAEDGRPRNLERLRKELPGFPDRLYPFAPHIRYAVLQKRDQQLLRCAGIPAEQIHLLPNPVSVGMHPGPVRQPPKRILYLTRAIRRKNIGEFLYWAACFDGELEFATSLIPENPEELKLFKTWQDFAHAEGITVRWGLGQTCPFEKVVEEADLCITTSVGEGFGMSFLEPFGMGRGVRGRNLPEITAGFTEDGIDLSALYPELPVPVDALDPEFWIRATAQIRNWRQSMGAEGSLDEAELKSAWVRDQQIDFGRLDEPAQRQVLRTLKGSLRRELLQMDHPQPVEQNSATMESHYSDGPSLSRLQALYNGLRSPGPVEYAQGDRVRDAFLDLSSVWLLRT